MLIFFHIQCSIVSFINLFNEYYFTGGTDTVNSNIVIFEN